MQWHQRFAGKDGMKRLLAVLCAFAAIAFGQQPETVRWEKAAPGCETLKEYGQPSKVLIHQDVGIRAALQRGSSKHLQVLLMVANGTKQAIMLNSKDVQLLLVSPKEQRLAPIGGEGLAAAIERSAMSEYQENHVEGKNDVEKNAIVNHAYRKGVNTDLTIKNANALVNQLLNPNGTPNSEEEKRLHEAAVAAALVKTNAWQDGNIAAGEKRKGAFYFAWKPFEEAVFQIRMAGKTYEIPFHVSE